MNLGNATVARVRLIVWCLDCWHQVEPDAAQMTERHGAETTVLDWHARLICGQRSPGGSDKVVTETERRWPVGTCERAV